MSDELNQVEKDPKAKAEKAPVDPFKALKAKHEALEAKAVFEVHPGDPKASVALRVDH